MTSKTLALDDRWQESLQLRHRSPPDFVQATSEVRDTPYAPAIRVALQELRLSGMFCVNGVPTVAIRRSSGYDPATTSTIRSALWNQGFARMFVDITDPTNTVRIFSLTGKQVPDGRGQSSEHGLIERIDATTSAIKNLHTYITGAETGRIWQEQSQFFLPDERVDAVMLNNLVVGHARLMEMGLTDLQAQAALIQTMFIAYLEGRKIIDGAYFERNTNQQYSNWIDLLDAGDVCAFKCLLTALREDFNGDIFVDLYSLEDTSTDVFLEPIHLNLLMNFCVGTEPLNRAEKDQMRFCGYDYHYIPVELLSEVYDKFLWHLKPRSQHTGAYYTPNFLANTVISSLWSDLSTVQKTTGRFMDPACGSGIFLVKLFQRLCQHRLETHPLASALSWDDLLNVLGRLRGYDVDPAAVRFAAFSLYLALLEQASYNQSIRLSDRRHQLPSLWGSIVTERNFFDEDYTDDPVDVIVGNPPWASSRTADPDAARWSDHNDTPFPKKDIAWAFTWKAATHLTDGGILAFILPSMAFLHNQTKVAIKARCRLFRNTTVKKVIDFSDLRRMLLPHSTRSASLIVATRVEAHTDSHYIFEYLTPKADPNLAIGQSISLASDEEKWIQSNEVERNCLVFKNHLHMHASEIGLFQYLSTLPTLGDFLRKLSQTPTQHNASLIGQGFKPITQSGQSEMSVPSSVLSTIPFMPLSAFTPIRIDPSHLPPYNLDHVYHLGFENGYSGTRILVPRGVKTPARRIRAAYVDAPVAFRHIIMAMRIPEGEVATAKFVTAILNSRLSLWFAFHGTNSFGAERPSIGIQELERLPIPFPADLSDSATSLQVFEKLVQRVDQFVPSSPDGSFDGDTISNVLHEIDQLTYRYFGLDDDEISLVEETVNDVIPAIQPSRGRYPSTWQPPSLEERRAYSGTLQRRLSDCFSGTQSPLVRLYARNDDYAVLEISLTSDPSHAYTESDRRPFSVAIAELSHALGEPIGVNFCVRPDIRIFAGSKLFTVKPLLKRFWLHASALADAGNIALDLEVLLHKSRTRRSIS